MAETQTQDFKSTQNAHTHTFPDCKITSEKRRTFQTSAGKTFAPRTTLHIPAKKYLLKDKKEFYNRY